MKLKPAEILELRAYVDDNGDCPLWLQEWASDHYCDEIPYGTLTGDTGTIDEWLCDRIDWVTDHFIEYLEPKSGTVGGAS